MARPEAHLPIRFPLVGRSYSLPGIRTVNLRYKSTTVAALAAGGDAFTPANSAFGARSQILSGRRRQPLVDELLHAVALRLAGYDISLRINVEAVQMEELTRLAPGSADVADLFER